MSPLLFGFLLLMLTRKVENVTFEQSSAQVVRDGTEEVRINCRHDENSLNRMLWYQHKQSSGSMSFIGYTVFMGEPVYEDQFKGRFQIKREDTVKGSLIIHTLNSSDSAVYFCAASKGTGGMPAYFGQGTKLTVLEREVAEPKVIVLPPSEKECRNKKDPKKKKTLVCVAEDFYPDHVSLYWQVDGENVTDGVATDNFAQQNETSKLYKITSRLRVSATDWFTSGKEFKCIVSFIRSNDTQEIYPASVEGVKPPDTDAMTRETFLKISQSAKLCYGVFIAKSCLYGAFVMFLVWKLQGSTGKWNN